MGPETFTAMDETLYRAVLMLIQGITLITGIAFLLFMLLCLAGSVCGWFGETGRPSRRQAKQSPEKQAPEAQDLVMTLVALDDGLDDCVSGSVAVRGFASIQ